MSYDEDIFQFNEEFDVPQSPLQTPIHDEYNYTYAPTEFGPSSFGSTFLYDCIICQTSSNVPCEHVSEKEEAGFQLNNEFIMSNYRKWQNITISS